jgi:hypothetical protein
VISIDLSWLAQSLSRSSSVELVSHRLDPGYHVCGFQLAAAQLQQAPRCNLCHHFSEHVDSETTHKLYQSAQSQRAGVSCAHASLGLGIDVPANALELEREQSCDGVGCVLSIHAPLIVFHRGLPKRCVTSCRVCWQGTIVGRCMLDGCLAASYQVDAGAAGAAVGYSLLGAPRRRRRRRRLPLEQTAFKTATYRVAVGVKTAGIRW